MSGPDWFRWYPAKWASGVIILTPEQRGVYIDIINVIYDRGECPEDYPYLSRVCNCRGPRVRRIIGELVQHGKLTIVSGTIRQERAHTERINSEQFSELQRQRGLGKRKNKDLAPAANGLAITTTTTLKKKESKSPSLETSIAPSPSEGAARFGQAGTDLLCERTGCDKPKRSKRREYPEAFQQFWLAYPQRGTDTKADAFKAWDKARQAGTDVALMQAGAERYAAYASTTGCETKHVQTWLNKECWTASYAKPNGAHHHGRQPAHGSVEALRRLREIDQRREGGARDDADDGPSPGNRH